METAIEVKGLTRKFGNLVAVDHVEFGVYQGEIFGFLGSNGAGKTTIVRMLTGVPTEGTATISANVSDSKSNNERSFEVMDANWHN